jgi:uncharacterized coiled-coil DUF342 family protein
MSEQEKKKKAGTATKPAKTGTGKSPKANTVNGKKALYKQTAMNFHQAANDMVAAGINNLQEGVNDMQKNIHKMQMDIQGQIEKYKQGAVAFQSGVAEMVEGIVAMQASIANQAKEHQEYIKQFYG